MREVRFESCTIAWDDEGRLALIRFAGETAAGREEATRLTGALRAWTGASSEPFGLLVDGSGLRNADLEYRAIWNEFVRTHRARCFIAVYRSDPIVQMISEMFRIGAGIELRSCADELAAREWLREMGIRA